LRSPSARKRDLGKNAFLDAFVGESDCGSRFGEFEDMADHLRG
jgi:hypothetical protein